MSFKKILGTIAPFLGGLIGGPFGAAAGKIAGKILCGDENASDQDMEKALATASPEKLIELKKADADYKIRMAELGIDEQKIAALDRDSARNREIETKDKVPAILAFLLTIGFFGVLIIIMLHSLAPTAAGVCDVMLGALGTAWIQCISYYFGSSAGSKLKTLMQLQK